MTTKVRFGWFSFIAVIAIVCTVAILLNASGALLGTMRIYASGKVSQERILECRNQIVASHKGASPGRYYIRASNIEGWVSIGDCDAVASIGEQVQVVRSKNPDLFVAVRGSPTILKVIWAAQGFDGTLGYVLVSLGVILVCSWRVGQIGRFSFSAMTDEVAKVRKEKSKRMDRLAGYADIAADMTFLVSVLTAIAAIMYVLAKGVITVQVSSVVWFCALSAVFLCLVVSPALPRIVQYAWRGYRSALARIVRTLMGSVPAIYLTVVITKFVQSEDLSTYKTVTDIVIAIGATALGITVCENDVSCQK